MTSTLRKNAWYVPAGGRTPPRYRQYAAALTHAAAPCPQSAIRVCVARWSSTARLAVICANSAAAARSSSHSKSRRLGSAQPARATSTPSATERCSPRSKPALSVRGLLLCAIGSSVVQRWSQLLTGTLQIEYVRIWACWFARGRHSRERYLK